MSDFDLASMTVEEKRRLRDSLTLDLAAGRPSFSREVETLWNVVTQTLQGQGLLGKRPMPLAAFAPKFGVAKLESSTAEITAIIDECCAKKGPAAQRTELRHLIIEALISQLIRQGVPLSPTSVYTHMQHSRQAVEAAFPGYLAAGLLLTALRGKQTPGLPQDP